MEPYSLNLLNLDLSGLFMTWNHWLNQITGIRIMITVYPQRVSSLEEFPHFYVLSPKVTVHKAKIKKEWFPRKLYEEIRYLDILPYWPDCPKFLNFFLFMADFFASLDTCVQARN